MNWKQALALVAAGVLRYVLHATEKLAIDFEVRLIGRIFRWLFRKDKKS